MSSNNHIDKHYEELYDLCTGMNSDKTIRELQKYNTRLIGIEWDIKRHPYHRLLRLCSDRVVGRGDNHATLRPDATGSEHEAIVGKFLRNYTSPDSDLFAQMIDVSVLVSPEEAVRHIISELSPLLHLPTIDDAQLLAAFESARQYKVTTAYHPPDKVSKAIRYYALAPEIDAGAVVEIGIYHMPPELAHPCQRFLSALQKNKRLISTPHVTLSHEGNVAEERESLGEKVAEEQGPQQRAWNACKRLSETGSPLWAYDVTHIAWDGRVMALILADLRILPSTASSHEDASSGAKLAVEGQVTEQSRRDAEDAILPTMVSHMHITVGTKTDDIRPYESRNVVGKAKEMIARGQQSGETDEVVEGGGTVRWAEIGKVEGEGRIKGMW
jgi:tRNA ligase